MKIINHVFESKYLGYKTKFNVISPTTSTLNEPLKVLYLLHGAYGDENDWLNNSNIIQLADEYNLLIVLPRGENRYYTNSLNGPQYESYIACELKYFIENTYPVSPNREDTFIAGLSMGGYGALNIAFNNLDKYSIVGCFSGVVDIAEVAPNRDNSIFRFDLTFGDITKLKNSKHDLFKLSKNIIESNKPNINTFITCGADDHLYEDNIRFIKHLDKIGYKYTYIELSGVHNWDFWKKSIVNFLEFVSH